MTEGEARRWCEAMGVEVLAYAHHGRIMHSVKVVGFHPQVAERLEHAVDQLDANLAHCLSWGDHGLCRATADRLRAARESFLSTQVSPRVAA